MRIAIVSDIHGNRTAFEAVLADLRQTAHRPDALSFANRAAGFATEAHWPLYFEFALFNF